MKRHPFLIRWTLVVVAGVAGSSAFLSCNLRPHTISAHIEGLANDTVFIEYAAFADYGRSSAAVEDTLIAANGRFVYDIPVETPTGVSIDFAQYRKTNEFLSNGTLFLVVLPGEKLTVTGKIEPDYLDYRVDGSAISSDYAELRPDCREDYTKYDSLLDRLIAYSRSDVSPTGEAWSEEEREAFLNPVEEAYYAAVDSWQSKKINYVKNHPDKDISAYYLARHAAPDTFDLYYPLLTEPVKTGVFQPVLKQKQLRTEQYKRKKENTGKIVAGAQAPDFTLKNLSGEAVSLSQLKGKYIVLDFWGSWCIWCIRGIPKMKEYYDKYSSKVEFVGVACRDSETAWREAVEKYQLNWTQLINDESGDIDKDVSVRYAIEGYPTKIILDKNQKIVTAITGESDEFYQKLDDLLK